jgi:uncharacterized protein Usg
MEPKILFIFIKSDYDLATEVNQLHNLVMRYLTYLQFKYKKKAKGH